MEKLARLRLIRSDGIGPVLFSRLIETNGSAINAIDYLQNQEKFTQPNTKVLKLAHHETIEREFYKHLSAEAFLLFLGEQHYPKHLAALPDAPPVLSVKGDISLLTKQSIGVVGARNASAIGMKFARQICNDLSQAGVIITSGLARGIDTVAHQASLAHGTIACLAGGIDIIYPADNTDLYEDIASNGLLVSEMPLGTKPQARHFPRRNRIISGLSDGVLVIEAAKKSGSLITARFAADQGREVFAAPGSPLDPRSQGTNLLIKDGAILTQSATDILDELSSMPLLRVPVSATTPKKVKTLENSVKIGSAPKATQNSLVSYLSTEPIHIDEIVRLSGARTEVVLGEFMTLELTGVILRHSGNRFSKISTEN